MKPILSLLSTVLACPGLAFAAAPVYRAVDVDDRGEILVAGSYTGDNIRNGPSRTFLLVPVAKR